jgi:hypothetical protein
MEMTLAFAMTAAHYHLAQTSVEEIGFAFRGSTCPTAPLMLKFGERGA